MILLQIRFIVKDLLKITIYDHHAIIADQSPVNHKQISQWEIVGELNL